MRRSDRGGGSGFDAVRSVRIIRGMEMSTQLRTITYADPAQAEYLCDLRDRVTVQLVERGCTGAAWIEFGQVKVRADGCGYVVTEMDGRLLFQPDVT